MPVYFTFTYKTYIEIGCYIVLLFFVVPIKIDDYELRKEFHKYLEDFNKSYLDKNVFNTRFEAFKKSLESIDSLNHNRTKTSALYGLTKFSDLLPEEFMLVQKNRRKTDAPIGNDFATLQNQFSKRSTSYWNTVPKKVDWREKHVVSGVKFQRNCGACWAFAVTETIETMKAIKSKNLTELSIQQMIDCSNYNNGCQGGDTCNLLSWIKEFNVTIETETNYPLVLKDQKCRKQNSLNGGVRISDYICDTFIGREDIILKLLATNGPVIVSVSGQTWQNYVGGVIQFHCDGEISHAVQIVGYDLTAEVPYYIVRNSWGKDFGDEGYLYMAVGSNICNVAYEVAAVTV